MAAEKFFLKLFFNPLRAHAKRVQTFGTQRAGPRQQMLGKAVVTTDVPLGHSGAMVNHGCVAVVALEHEAALGIGAANVIGIPPPIQQQHDLPVIAQRASDRVLQGRSNEMQHAACPASGAGGAELAFLAQINNLHRGHGHSGGADSQLMQRITRLGWPLTAIKNRSGGVVPRFKAGRGRAEQDSAVL